MTVARPKFESSLPFWRNIGIYCEVHQFIIHTARGPLMVMASAGMLLTF